MQKWVWLPWPGSVSMQSRDTSSSFLTGATPKTPLSRDPKAVLVYKFRQPTLPSQERASVLTTPPHAAHSCTRAIRL